MAPNVPESNFYTYNWLSVHVCVCVNVCALTYLHSVADAAAVAFWFAQTCWCGVDRLLKYRTGNWTEGLEDKTVV